MPKPILTITDLVASIEANEILKKFSLEIAEGEIYALMGQNGSGKSTLAHVLAGHPSYEVQGGSVSFLGEDLVEMPIEERAQKGLFLAFQYPMSIPGVTIAQFLKLAKNAQEKAKDLPQSGLALFLKTLKAAMKELELPWSFAERAVNDGFSGGEKKRLEMLQMLVLQPKLVILDEIDSGLDIDAMSVVAKAVHSLRATSPETAFIIITHYQRLLNHIAPDQVHIVKEGKIIQSGGPELAHKLEKEGYANLA